MLGYPGPRYPSLRRPKSVEELMPRARELVSQVGQVDNMSIRQDYSIKAGDKILWVVLSEYEPMVIEAMCRAIREKGARVDVFTLDSSPVAPPEELAAHEAIALGKEEGNYSYYYTVICDLIGTNTAKAMANLEKYSLIISGSAGLYPAMSGFRCPWRRFNFTSLEDFAGPFFDSSPELLNLIDKKVYAQVMSCDVLRLTDPEGTDVKWTNYKDKRRFVSDHIFARSMDLDYLYSGKDDCAGVIAGTTNHMGAFPHLKAYLEGGQVVKVEGSGKYGDVWREKIEEYKNVRLPYISHQVTKYGAMADGLHQPDDSTEGERRQAVTPGVFLYYECAIGTIPSIFRNIKEARMECYANCLHERRRSGVIHNGFGPPITTQQELIEAGLPWVHVHIHCLFATLEGKVGGKTLTIIDKGHLTALDDPEVRLLAKKYGNPDKLLTETWIPALPGINVPGDYMKDYGRDPISWNKKEAAEHPIWID